MLDQLSAWFPPALIDLFITSFWETLVMVGISGALGALIGIPLGVSLRLTDRGGVLESAAFNRTVGGLVNAVRSTPFIILLVAIIPFTRLLTGSSIGTFCALLAFALNTAGYTAEMLAGAIRETSHGEIEAAQAMGMSRWTVLRRIVLPSAMRRTLPAYSNEVVMMLHSTSLASTVPSMLDVNAAAGRIYSDFYLPFEAYIAAAIIYLCVSFTMVGLFKLAEGRFLAHLAPRKH